MIIRNARPGDEEQLVALIRALARYENREEQVVLQPADLTRFFNEKLAFALVAETEAGEMAGFALYYTIVSTFSARAGLYIEDIFVLPEERGQGIGYALMAELASRAQGLGGSLSWSCLTWNAPAQEFYRRLGAIKITEWDHFSLTGSDLAELAKRA